MHRRIDVTTRYKTRRSGQAMVEFALLLPVLLLLAAGAVDIGRLYSQTGIIANAARQGARYGAINPVDSNSNINSTAIDNEVIASAAGSGLTLTTDDISTSLPSGRHTVGNPIRVQVTYTMPTIVGSVLHVGSLTVMRECTMECFGTNINGN